MDGLHATGVRPVSCPGGGFGVTGIKFQRCSLCRSVQSLYIWNSHPPIRHHEYGDEKLPDKLAGSRFPGGYNNDVGFSYHHSDDVCNSPLAGGDGPWPMMAIKTLPLVSDCCSDDYHSFYPECQDRTWAIRLLMVVYMDRK
ncbi:hypothetical protein AVEN_101916-1 [Araneus ventricosus]|uniref:Uncharacterized protein n=1 Tax=Araneus ventricosus TaxID=182803 RepID=A0A4Y2D8L4_ARAVE|nr:hypothetical protein AVEN_101916-1 [Araneus ventricosus]